jgi:phage baseplate assembly protein V
MTDAAYERLFARPQPESMFLGVAVGVVTNNKDPDGLGRVRLKLPWLSDDLETDWARMAVPMAGKERGFYFLPEVDDEVLVAFEHGSPQSPFVVGVLWNGKDKPPEKNSDGKNDVRSIKSRSGHVIRLTDKSGAEKIEIVDKSGKNTIAIDTSKNTVTITAEADITLESKTGAVTLKGKSVKIDAQSDVAIQGASKAELKTNGALTVKGQIVNIN